jgi:tetratricopeptide (TPR) repeat protein
MGKYILISIRYVLFHEFNFICEVIKLELSGSDYYTSSMKKLIFVVFLLLFAPGAYADAMQDSVSKIEANWVNTSEAEFTPARKNIFLQLADDISDVVLAFPRQAEPLILQSAILLTMAEDASSFVALGLVKQAKNLLAKAIDINPEARDGSALVTMGILYYKVPGWPVAFGDDDQAETYLLKALDVNPNGVTSNYFYAEFLLEQGKDDQAVSYLNKAIGATLDPENTSFKIKVKHRAKAKAALASLS